MSKFTYNGPEYPKNWIYTAKAYEVRTAVSVFLKENPNGRRGRTVRTMASHFGGDYRDTKASGKVSRACRTLANEDPSIEACRERGFYRYVGFEERAKRAEEASERARKKGLGETLAKYLEKENVKVKAVDYDGRVTLSADDLFWLLNNHEPVRGIGCDDDQFNPNLKQLEGYDED